MSEPQDDRIGIAWIDDAGQAHEFWEHLPCALGAVGPTGGVATSRLPDHRVREGHVGRPRSTRDWERMQAEHARDEANRATQHEKDFTAAAQELAAALDPMPEIEAAQRWAARDADVAQQAIMDRAPAARDRTFLQALEARVIREELWARHMAEPNDARLKRVTAKAEHRYQRRLRRLLDE